MGMSLPHACTRGRRVLQPWHQYHDCTCRHACPSTAAGTVCEHGMPRMSDARDMNKPRRHQRRKPRASASPLHRTYCCDPR